MPRASPKATVVYRNVRMREPRSNEINESAARDHDTRGLAPSYVNRLYDRCFSAIPLRVAAPHDASTRRLPPDVTTSLDFEAVWELMHSLGGP